MAASFCSGKRILILFLISAVPIAFLISLETAKPTTHVYEYHSTGWLRECTKWDPPNRRFLVSFMEGGVGQISLPDDYTPGTVLKEIPVVKDVDLAGKGSVGMVIDRPRNRLLVVISDVFGNRYGGLAAYDLTTWNRSFLTQLSGPDDEKSLANDVAVDAAGNSYVTDAKGSQIWKVGVNGDFLSTIKSPLFTPKDWYKHMVTLNGIVSHPDGYLLVVHTFSGDLFKIDTTGGGGGEEADQVTKVNVTGGPLRFGDGLELLSPSKLVVAGNPSRLVESSDGWKTGKVIGKFWGAVHRFTTTSTVKDGKVYLNHLIGLGYPNKKHLLVEANFS